MKNLTILFLALFLVSCTNEDVLPSETAIDYISSQEGNYWVYDWYEISSDGERLLHENDTVSTLPDTIISNKAYFVHSPHQYGGGNSILFDSVNTIYSYPERQIVFTLDNSQTQTIDLGPKEDPIISGTYQLQDEELVDVPAGSFSCVNWRGEYVSYDDDYEHGSRYNDNYYSKNVGRVKIKMQFYSSPNDLEARLISYGNLSNN